MRPLQRKLSTQDPWLSIMFLAERVGFEPTVPLLGRMLSKHVDSTTLAPLRIDVREGRILTRGLVTGKVRTGPICMALTLPNPLSILK